MACMGFTTWTLIFHQPWSLLCLFWDFRGILCMKWECNRIWIIYMNMNDHLVTIFGPWLIGHSISRMRPLQKTLIIYNNYVGCISACNNSQAFLLQEQVYGSASRSLLDPAQCLPFGACRDGQLESQGSPAGPKRKPRKWTARGRIQPGWEPAKIMIPATKQRSWHMNPLKQLVNKYSAIVTSYSTPYPNGGIAHLGSYYTGLLTTY